MTLYELVAKISLDTTSYDKGLAASKKSMASFSGAVMGGFGKLAKIAKNTLMGASAAVTAFGVTSVKTGLSFDKAMSQVAATSGKTMKEMETEVGSVDLAWGKFSGNLRDYALEMGRNTAFSATEAAEALNYMALAGYDTQKSMEMLPNVLNMAAAGNMDLAKASDMVTDVSTALGLSQGQTNAMVDQMAMAAASANTSVEQLGSAMLRVGGTAKLMRGGTQELSTAIGILADNGTKGAEAGTAMRNILMGISKGKFEKSFGSLGVQAYDAEGKMRPLKDVFMDMNEVMEGMTDKEKNDLITSAFNSRDLKNVNALLATSSERWDELSGKIGDSEGAAQEMADTQLDNLAGDMTLFKSALEGAQIAVSDGLSPALREFVQTGTEGISKVGNLFAKGKMSKGVEAMGQLLGNMTALAVSKAPDMIKAGGQLLIGLGNGIVKNVPQIMSSLKTAISEAVGALGNIALSTEGIKMSTDLFKGFGEGITSGLRTISIYGNLILSSLTTIIGNVGTSVAEGLKGIFQGLDLAGMVTNNIGTLLDMMTTAMTSLTEIGTVLLEGIGTGIRDSLPSLLENVLPMIVSFTEALRENAGTLIDAGLEFVMNIAQGLINSIPVLVTYVPTIITNIARIINDNAPKLLIAGLTIIKNLVAGIIKAGPVIVASIPKIILAIFNVFMAFNWISIGTSIITFIKDGIVGMAKAIPDVFSNIFESVISWITSVSWTSVGSGIVQLIVTGIQGLAGLIPAALRTIASAAVAIFKSINWAAVGKAAMTMLGSGIQAVSGLIKGIITKMVTAVRNKIKTGFNAAKEAAVKAFEAIKNGISKKIQAAQNVVKGVVDKIKGFFPVKIGKIFSGWIPKIKLSTTKGKDSASTKSSVSHQNFAKAMDNPYMFKRRTEFYAGEAGDEMLYGKRALMQDIESAVANGDNGNQVYITNYITVEEAEDGEKFARDFVRRLELDMRTA